MDSHCFVNIYIFPTRNNVSHNNICVKHWDVSIIVYFINKSAHMELIPPYLSREVTLFNRQIPAI